MIRTLPHNAEAENAVLGAVMLRGRNAFDEAVEFVGESDFYQPRAQAVFRSMSRLSERGDPIDAITLEADLRSVSELELVGGIEGLASLDRYATAHNVKAHANIVRSLAHQRAAVTTCREIADEGLEDLEDLDAWHDSVEARLMSMSTQRQTGGPRHASEGMADVFQSITDRQRANGVVTGVAYPWKQINQMTSGAQPTDLVIIAARPSMGKTAFALNLAQHASVSMTPHAMMVDRYLGEHDCTIAAAYEALSSGENPSIPRRTPVLFFSLEMGEAQLIERQLCSDARVDAQAVRQGSRLMEQDFRGLISAADRLTRHGDLWIDDRPGLSINEIRSTARSWWRKECKGRGPGGTDARCMVMVDYIQLASSPGAGSREQEISAISRGLKGLAKELGAPVIALSQLNRKVDDRADHTPNLADLRESGAIEQDADVIMFITRPERYLPNDASDDKRAAVEGKAEVIIGKQRNGPIGTVHLIFMKKFTRFEDPVDAYSR